VDLIARDGPGSAPKLESSERREVIVQQHIVPPISHHASLLPSLPHNAAKALVELRCGAAMVAGPLGKVVEKRESRGRWWVGWMDIFDDVRHVLVSKAVCSYHGA
jgi:hypothetical protein